MEKGIKMVEMEKEEMERGIKTPSILCILLAKEQ
jgi:hypothetical protein